MNGVLGHDSALLRLYWAGDNLGELGIIYVNSNVDSVYVIGNVNLGC